MHDPAGSAIVGKWWPFGSTVDYLIMHELIMHKSRNAWVLVGNNDGTQGKCIHNA